MPTYFIDTATSQVWRKTYRSPVLAFNFQRGASPSLAVQYISDGAAVADAGSATVTLGFKSNKTDATYLIPAVTGTGSSPAIYTFAPSFLSTALDTALGTADSVLAYGEFKYLLGDLVIVSPFIARVFANVIRGGEGGPGVQVTGNEVYLSSITGLEGGTDTDLDAVSTTGLGIGTLIRVVTGGVGVQSTWRVEAGTADTDLDNGIIKPADYNASTNIKNLIRVEGS